MATIRKFTDEQQKILMNNPYVFRITPARLTFTLEFKQFFMAQSAKGFTAKQIFEMAGFDIDMLGYERIHSASKSIKSQAKSPEGLKPPYGLSKEERMERFAKEDFSRKYTKAALKELQEKVVHLEQQIEFLKKIQSLDQ